jgi:fructose-1,6-bisphosphatase I
MRMITTFEEHMAQQQMPPETADLPWILSGITLATKMIEAQIRCAGLLDALGSAGAVNIQGEAQQKLDVFANEALLHCLATRDHVIALISEENEKPITFKRGARGAGRYIIVFDPLDGSSNIDVNISVGTIFSIYLRPRGLVGDPGDAILSPSAEQLVAGYVIYGTSTMLVYTAGKGVYGFTLDPAVGAYVLSHDNMVMPRFGNYYSCNEAYSDHFPEQYRVYIDHLRARPNGVEYSSRYVGSLVADFHRTLIKGGVFLYPPTANHPKGKLRLLYETRPLAFIAEQAGGLAIDGTRPILSVAASDIHDRTPLVLGSRREVEIFASLSPATESLICTSSV